jgi:putative FmdB family regulatory protein
LPTYEYTCTECGATLQVRASMGEKAAGLSVACDRCGSARVRRLFRPVAVVGGGATAPLAAGPGGGCCGAGGCACAG